MNIKIYKNQDSKYTFTCTILDNDCFVNTFNCTKRLKLKYARNYQA